MSLLRIDSSIRTEGSVGRAVADSYESAWRAAHPSGQVVVRDLGTDPIPATTWPATVAASRTPAADHDATLAAAAATSAAIADQVFGADTIVISTALYNFGVSQHLKAWIDILFTDPRLAAGTVRPLTGHRVVVVIARGGGYGPGTPREGWDHAIGWIRRVFADVWGADVETIEAELTLAPIVPAMAELVGLSEQIAQNAHSTAGTLGRSHGELARTAA